MTVSASEDDALGSLRWLVGRPSILRAAGETAIGALWLTLAIVEGFTAMHVVLFVFWFALGFGQGATAVVDRKHRRGRYAGLRAGA
jgi:hypothetical protein